MNFTLFIPDHSSFIKKRPIRTMIIKMIIKDNIITDKERQQ